MHFVRAFWHLDFFSFGLCCVHVYWYSWIERTRHCQISVFFFCHRLLLFTPFRREVIVLLLYHLFLYAITLTFIFSNWTHAFDYNFRKRYCQTSDITRYSITVRSKVREREKQKWDVKPLERRKKYHRSLRYSNHFPNKNQKNIFQTKI